MKTFPKTCALVAVSLALPVLAYTTNRSGNKEGDTPERHEDNKGKDKNKSGEEAQGREDKPPAPHEENKGREENLPPARHEESKGREENLPPGWQEDKKGKENKGDHPVPHEDNKGKGEGNKHEEHKGDKGGKGHGHVPLVPETNAAWVLLPFLGVVLLLSWRQLFRSKA